MEIGLLVIQAFVGLTFVAHGMQTRSDSSAAAASAARVLGSSRWASGMGG